MGAKRRRPARPPTHGPPSCGCPLALSGGARYAQAATGSRRPSVHDRWTCLCVTSTVATFGVPQHPQGLIHEPVSPVPPVVGHDSGSCERTGRASEGRANRVCHSGALHGRWNDTPWPGTRGWSGGPGGVHSLSVGYGHPFSRAELIATTTSALLPEDDSDPRSWARSTSRRRGPALGSRSSGRPDPPAPRRRGRFGSRRSSRAAMTTGPSANGSARRLPRSAPHRSAGYHWSSTAPPAMRISWSRGLSSPSR